MVLYYIITLGALLLSIPFLFDYITISMTSFAPIVLIFVSVVQFIAFRDDSNIDNTNSTSYSLNEFDLVKQKAALKYHSIIKLIIIPILCPFIIYFDELLKLFSVLIYFLSFFIAPIMVKISCKGKRDE